MHLLLLASAFAADFDLSPTWRAGTVAWLDQGLRTGDFSTGDARFDDEWLYGTWMMAAMGFGEHARTHPADRAEDLAHMEVALDRLFSAESRAFDARAWGADPLASLAGDRGHVAWLGYTAMALGLHRTLVPDSRYNPVHDRIVEAIERRLEVATDHLVETYPGEWYPVDNAAMIGALALHTRATGATHPMAAAWVETARLRWVDPGTGLLVQAVRDGQPADHPRGSGTFLASWFLHPADPAFAAELYRAGVDRLSGSILGFGVMREYPPGVAGREDVDSGPIVAGYGVSATGFAIGAALQNGDFDRARSLAATAWTTSSTILAVDPSLAGPPNPGSASGSAIGDTILFAMTASAPLE